MSDESLDYDEIQAKLNPTEESNDADLDDLENDLEFSMSEEDKPDKDEFADTEVEPEAEVEEKPEETTEVTKEAAAGPVVSPTDKAIAEQVVRLMGDDVLLRVKDYEKKASELNPAELVAFLQKGIRSDQLFQEAAAARKQLDSDRALVEKGALAVQQMLEQINAESSRRGPVTQIPEYLRPHPDDSEEIKNYKLHQLQLMDEVNAVKQQLVSKEVQSSNQREVDTIVGLAKTTYPMASIDEVLAVKSVRPNINSEELLQASHNYYSSKDFIKKALDSNPTAKREYDDEVIRQYVSRQNKAKTQTVAGKRHGSTSADAVSKGTRRISRDFDTADSLSREYLKEVDRINRGD